MRKTKGLKDDNGKPRVELLSADALIEISKVMTYGADKYTRNGVPGEHNWRKGFKWSRLLGAVLRHLFCFMRGEDTDKDSGLPHLAHAGCCIMFLLEHQTRSLGIDDRYKYPAVNIVNIKSEIEKNETDELGTCEV